MDITVFPGLLSGSIQSIPSKSQAHRYLICAAFSDLPTQIHCSLIGKDISATVECLAALGAVIDRVGSCFHVTPVGNLPKTATLRCGESGSTLRFLLPIVGALGIDAKFILSGRLPDRPLSPLWEVMEQMGCKLSYINDNTVHCCGKLKSGTYCIPGNISSQFISGMMMALPLIDGPCQLRVTGAVESKPYIEMTRESLAVFGISDCYSNGVPYRSPLKVIVEGDWSNAAFFFAANALGAKVSVLGLDPGSIQGDKQCIALFRLLETQCNIDVTHIPDLLPILAVVAAFHQGAVFQNIRRLRMKESDRVCSVSAMLKSLGIMAYTEDNQLFVLPGRFRGGVVDSFGDHRIAMAAAIAATAADGAVTILGADSVEKSYPGFWDALKALGGNYE